MHLKTFSNLVMPVIRQTETVRKGLGSSATKWWSKGEGKEKRDTVINEIRLNEDSRGVQSIVQQPNSGNGLVGIMPCRNLSHPMTSGKWRHFGSAISSGQCTIPCPPDLVRRANKEDPTFRYAMADSPQSMS